MPTPVSAARQCLAGEAAATLDEAVVIARRRAHAQTTSLHVVSALLSLPSSSSSLLRDALSRARSSAYSPRLQFKALELCFSVALDRLPSSSSTTSSPNNNNNSNPQQAPAEPPVSNSLMAAIKRSQANQRRNPDTFHLYQHQQQQQQQQQQPQSSSFVGVKVELQQLVLSILDDPVVSRVFGEAGFRSCDIKFAVLRPPPSVLRFPRAARCPPLFLCNFSIGGDEFDLTPRSFGFPFSGQPLNSDGADENCRRIAEILTKKKGRNPLLVGVGACDAARDFERTVGTQNWTVFPPETRWLKFFSIEKEVSEFVRGGRDRSWLDSKFDELGRWLAAADSGSGPGVVASVGDLKGFVDVSGEDKDVEGAGGATFVVSELTRLVDVHKGKLWLMGSAASYEMYMKFLSLYPSVDKDWDLQLLPITSLRPGSGGLSPRPNSLMESFVPFGGFFPMASSSMVPSSRPFQSTFRCHLCNDKYEQDVASILKEFSVPVADKHQMNLAPWLQPELTSINYGQDVEKAKDDGTVLNAKVVDLQKKWNGICQRHHQGSKIPETDNFQVGAEAFPRVIDIPRVADKESSGNRTNKSTDATQSQCGWEDAYPMAVGLQKISSANQGISMPVVSEPKNVDLLSKLQVRPSKSEQIQTNGFPSHSGALSDLCVPGDRTSPSSVTSVSTDLMLGTIHAALGNQEKSMFQPHTEHLHDLSGCFMSKKVDVVDRSVSVAPVQYSSCLAYSYSPVLSTYLPVQTPSSSKVASAVASASHQRSLSSSNNMCQQCDPRDFKTFCRSLTEKVGRQEEAICAISQTVARCRTGTERLRGASLKGDIWLSFLGPDKVGKKKIAMALAELLFGSRENIICVDLSLQDGVCSNTICDKQEINGYDVKFRGKTVVDHIAGEISKKPLSVVFLENVDKADLLLQNSLSQAIRTGKFSDSHRREIGINNAVFVTTARAVKGKTVFSSKEQTNFSEERILGAQPWQMKIVAESVSDSPSSNSNVNVLVTSRKESRNLQQSPCSIFVSKRKLNIAHSESLETAKRAHKTSNKFLDLNLPIEEMVANDTDCSSDGSNSMSENSEAWMEDFLDAVDETVTFTPFDFDALADDIVQEIGECFQTTFGSKCVLEIAPKVMEQILAATWLLEGMGALNNWLQRVLVRSFVEAGERYKLSAQTLLRLVACEEDALVEDHAPGILLPSRILLN